MDKVEANTAATGRALQAMGKSGRQAGDDIDRAERSVKKSSTSYAALGAAATTVAGFLSDASRAAAQDEAVFASLEASVTATGASFDAYATRIDAAIKAGTDLAFADDQVAQGLSTLTQITNDAGQALDLVGLAMDVARGRGISLAQASTLVGRAAEGQTAALSRMGIVLQEGATAQDALLALQTRFAGQSESFASSTEGSYQRAKNAVADFTENLGASTGSLQVALTLLPGISAGYTLLGGTVGKAAEGIKSLRASSAVAAAAFGPVGIGLAAVAGASVLAYGAIEQYKQRQDNAVISTEELAVAAENLIGVLNRLKQAGATDPALEAANQVGAVLDTIALRSEAVDDDRLNTVNDQLDRLNLIIKDINETGGYMRELGVYFGPEHLNDLENQAFALENVKIALEGAKIKESELAETHAALDTIFKDSTRENYPQLIAGVNGLVAAYLAGDIGGQAFVDGIQQAAAEVDTYGVSLNDLVPSLDAVTAAYARINAARIAGINRTAGPRREGIENPDEGPGPVDFEAEAARNAAAQEAFAAALARSGDAMGRVSANARENAAALAEARQAAVAFVGDAERIVDVLQAMGDAGADLSIAEGVVGAQAALDGTFAVIAGGTQALGQASQQVADFASELAGVTYEAGVFAYTFAAVDQALASGLIGTQEYNAAVDATKRILLDNAEVQANLNAIQAQQLPFLAEQASAYENQIEALSRLAPAEQRHALAMIDAGSRAQIASTYATAYSASLGQIPETVASEIILNDAAVNPILQEYYIKKGLIEKDPITGELTVNFDAVPADKATQAVDGLTDAIEDLTALIAELNGINISPGVDDKTLTYVSELNSKLGETESVMERINRWGGITPPAGPSSDGTGGYVAAGDGTGGPVASNSSIEGLKVARTETITVKVEAAQAYADVADLVGRLREYAGGDYTSTLAIAGDQAFSVVRDVEGAIVALTQGENVVRITGDTADATNDVALVNEALNTINGTVGVVYVQGDNSGAIAAVTTAEGRRDAYAGTSALAFFNGDASGAVGAADQAAGALYSIDGDTGIIYVNGNNAGAIGAIGAVTGFQGYATIQINAVRGTGFEDLTRRLGGGVYAPIPVPHAANGRVVTVGEAGQENVILPYGSQVIPHGASRSMDRVGGRRDDRAGINVYGTINVYPQNDDVYAAIRAQVLGSER